MLLYRATVVVGVTNPAPLTADVVLAIKSYYKVVLVGDSGVGKSLILSTLAESYPILDHYVSTTGVNIKIHAVEKDGKTTKLQLWDSASIKPIITSYCQGAHGIIVVYDVTDQDRYNNVKEWLKQSIYYADSNVKTLLIGNKCDLADEKVVSFMTAKAFADEIGIHFMETSALNSFEVEQSFLAMFSAMTYRNWSCLNTDLLVEIFNRASAEKPDVRSLMVRVCSAWRKTIFSTPPWPTVLCPLLHDEEYTLKYDEWVPRPFQFVDPIRNHFPIHIGMLLIGCDGNRYLFVDSLRDSLVLWNLLISKPGKPDLEQHEELFELPHELISLEDIYLGSSVCINGIGRRMILAGQRYDCVLVAATFSQDGQFLESWTRVKCPNRIFVSMVFCDNIAYLLDHKGDLYSVRWEGSRIVLYERSVSSVKQGFFGHTSFSRPHRGDIASCLITLPGTTKQEPDRLVCLNYESDRSAFFWASHLYEVELNGLMAFKELWDLRASTVFLSESRCIPLVVRKPTEIGYYESAVFCFCRPKTDGLCAYNLNEHIDHFYHLEFNSDWPFSFFALPDWKEQETVSASEKAQTSD